MRNANVISLAEDDILLSMMAKQVQQNTSYYVGTLAAYVLVEEPTIQKAAEVGESQLREFYAEKLAVEPMEVPLEIKTVRPATEKEIAAEASFARTE